VQRAYRLLVLLLLVDVEEVVKPLQELHRAAMGADAVLICAWSNEVGALHLLGAFLCNVPRSGWCAIHTPGMADLLQLHAPLFAQTAGGWHEVCMT
jgi:hypothetical protein